MSSNPIINPGINPGNVVVEKKPRKARIELPDVPIKLGKVVPQDSLKFREAKGRKPTERYKEIVAEVKKLPAGQSLTVPVIKEWGASRMATSLRIVLKNLTKETKIHYSVKITEDGSTLAIVHNPNWKPRKPKSNKEAKV